MENFIPKKGYKIHIIIDGEKNNISQQCNFFMKQINNSYNSFTKKYEEQKEAVNKSFLNDPYFENEYLIKRSPLTFFNVF